MKYAKKYHDIYHHRFGGDGSFQFLSGNSSSLEELTTSEFNTMVQDNEFTDVNIIANDNAWEVEARGSDDTVYRATIPPSETLVETLEGNGVSVSYNEDPGDPWWMNLLIMLVPTLLIIGIFLFMMNQSQGGGSKVMQFGKSRAKMQEPNTKKVTFADVAGVDEVREELQEVVDFLKDNRKYSALGAKIPKGVLLFGYPGTGKPYWPKPWLEKPVSLFLHQRF